ncbi:MAG: pentapeptide repeat-containing protein [Solirubrobacteraceae bacterium]
MTERFTHAIDQLGNADADVRIGGIYALERIVRDSPRDHQAVMEVLTAFIRNRVRDTSKSTISPDVHAALTVIGRRRHTNNPSGFRINLEGADLCYANLPRARLERAVLNGAQLQGAILAEAYLTNGDMAQRSAPN